MAHWYYTSQVASDHTSLSIDVTFHEQESYFTIPYLQGENLVMEDKDRGDFLFLDLLSLPLSKQSRPTDHLIETLPKLLDYPELVLLDQPKPMPENPKSDPENVRFNKVFSRKKTVVPESVKVQDFNLNSENEGTISNPSLQFESHVNNVTNISLLLLGKGLENAQIDLYTLLHTSYPLKKFHQFKEPSL